MTASFKCTILDKRNSNLLLIEAEFLEGKNKESLYRLIQEENRVESVEYSVKGYSDEEDVES